MPKFINDILECNRKIYMAITGGGTRAVSELLENGGASDVFVGANIPYAAIDLARFVDAYTQRNVLKCCTKETAQDMSLAALEKCKEMSLTDDHLNVGLGCTAVLSKGMNEREGRINQAFISVLSDFKIIETHVEFLNDDRRSIGRLGQEDMLSTLILSALADFVKSPPLYIIGQDGSNPYVRIRWQGRKLT